MNAMGGENRGDSSRSIDEQVRKLLERQLEHDPAEYHRHRFDQLLAWSDRYEQVADLLQGSFDLDEFGIEFDGGGPAGQDSVWRFVTMDSVVQVHAAAEATLRFFFAMLDGQWSPFVAVAGERNWGELKRRVDAWRSKDQDEARKDVLLGIYANADIAVQAQDSVVDILRDAARVWLDDGDVYNAIKHGPAAISGG